MNRVKIVAPIACAWALTSVPAAAQFDAYKVVYSFCAETDCADGAVPYGQLAVDAQGNLYGTTVKGGAANAGTLFMLKPGKHDSWTYTLLHSFCTGDCADGKNPHAGPILDTDGKLYGTTPRHGVAYRLDPGTGQFDILHAVGDSYAPLTFKGGRFDGHSTLYGTTAHGGERGKGSVFALKPHADGSWGKDTLWSFCSRRGCLDGAHPYGGVSVGDRGLVGVTMRGGPDNGGVGYVLSKGAMIDTLNLGRSAQPKFVTPFLPRTQPGYMIPERFGLIEYYAPGGGYTNWGAYDDGRQALSGATGSTLNGDVLGAASRGGLTGVDPEGGGTIWAFNTLSHGVNDVHFFCHDAGCADGSRPMGAMTYAFGDTYYGTTTQGGAHGAGVVFEFQWTSPPR
ncbi:MAG TPA: choice-of-anchor tandem repeat GloVer-containing protein [Rhizomicrobium sp.]|nr:choice-of-anchor tandem repeat GloVer-containing protein [Rhizomicrobium sp.]